MNYKKYLAELIGAFALTLGVALSLNVDMPLATPLIAGLILGTAVYTVGEISGAHLNPAVTIALATVKKINWKDAGFYVLFQLVGAVLAMGLAEWFTGAELWSGFSESNSFKVGVAEALGAAVLVFGVSAVAWGKVDDDASGITVGASLLIGILFASGFSNGVLNPAVAVGIGSVSYVYLLAPIVGGILAAWIYKFIQD